MESQEKELGSRLDEDFVSSLLHDKTSFASAASCLLQVGVATVRLPAELETIPARAFGVFRRVLREIDESTTCGDVDVLPANADSAHATGYHGLGGLSRYNQYRRGFVFSDGGECPVDAEFQDATQRLFVLLHAIFQHALTALEGTLGLPTNWFQTQLGPTISNSQWHLKKYCTPSSENEKDDTYLLGTHTDPSLLSVVIHDRPGIQADGYGLQYKQQQQQQQTWKDVSATGHGVAVILVGSVLAKLSANRIPACPHRVVATSATTTRVAATFFGRPAPQALLQAPPCPTWNVAANHDKVPITFEAWNARVARNYEKSKRKHQQTTPR